MMGIVRCTPAIIADNLDMVLPRGWKDEKFVGWRGGQAVPPAAAAADNSGNPPGRAGGAGAGAGGNVPPKASWMALFWSEVSLLEAARITSLRRWPLLPITTGELVSCSILQQVCMCVCSYEGT